jgi:hypothetical protein
MIPPPPVSARTLTAASPRTGKGGAVKACAPAAEDQARMDATMEMWNRFSCDGPNVADEFGTP